MRKQQDLVSLKRETSRKQQDLISLKRETTVVGNNKTWFSYKKRRRRGEEEKDDEECEEDTLKSLLRDS